MSLLELQSVTKTFTGNSLAVENVSLQVTQGELLALTGESGCGKTTLLRIIAGLEQPDGGSVYLDNQLVAGNGHFIHPQHRQVGLVFQDYALFPHMTVAKNIIFGLGSWSRTERHSRLMEMLKLVELKGFEDRYPHQLSGGQQQRVAIARALAPKPKLLLLDEPFSNLDTLLKDQVRREVSAILRLSGTTAILVTHDIQDAMSMADRIAILRNGRLLQVGVPNQLYDHPMDSYIASFFGKVNLIPVTSDGGRVNSEIGSLDLNEIGDKTGILCLRPQHITIVKDNESATLSEIIGVTYLGNCQQLELKTGGCQLWCIQPLNVKYSPGQEVNLRFDLGGAHVIWDQH
ncbi:MAG: iron(III) ABC transporter ATP-binding protein [Cyclobacteriaceae bacterium]|nr:MAG: iron(III) ABC transporter ATP-binding protein [Cyclobacteriaceae bacterium]